MFEEWITSLHPEILEWLGVSRLAGALAILVLGLVAAKILQILLDRFILRLAQKTKTSADEDILAVIRRPLWQTVIIFSAGLALSWLDPGEKARFFLIALLESAAIMIWLAACYRLTTIMYGLAAGRLEETGRSGADFMPLVANLTRVILITAAIMTALAVWNINITPLLASAGIAGLAVALAAKDTLANFFGGVSVFVDRPYKIGDYINLDSGERGEVVDIGIRSTRIQTRDDIQIIIPNSAIAAAKIINESAPKPSFRARIQVSVAYGSDLNLVEKLLLDAAAANELVVDKPPSRVRFRTFGDSGLNFELLCWLADPRDRGRAVHELNRAVYDSFNRHGVIIPFPQLDLHVPPAGTGQAR